MTVSTLPSPDDVPESDGIFATIREALRGSTLDYTTAPVGRAVIMLAVPMVMEMAMESIFAVADVFWVAHLGADAVATVGLTESMLTMIYTAAMGLSIGATALVARRTGEQDPEGASRAAGQSILLGLAVAVAIAVLAAPQAENLLRMMGASENVVRSGKGFTGVMLGGNATVLLLFMEIAEANDVQPERLHRDEILDRCIERPGRLHPIGEPQMEMVHHRLVAGNRLERIVVSKREHRLPR